LYRCSELTSVGGVGTLGDDERGDGVEDLEDGDTLDGTAAFDGAVAIES